jgi:hypothetical protein
MASDESACDVTVVFRFPNSTEIRSVRAPPGRGQRVESQSGTVWFVAEVLTSGRKTYTVECVSREDFARELGGRRITRLVPDLLAATRKAIRSRHELRHAAGSERSPRLEARDGGIETWHAPSAPERADHRTERRRNRDRTGEWLETYLSGTLEDRLAEPAPRRRRTDEPRGGWIETYLSRTPEGRVVELRETATPPD